MGVMTRRPVVEKLHFSLPSVRAARGSLGTVGFLCVCIFGGFLNKPPR